MRKSKQPKIRWSPLTAAERAKIEDIGQPWDPPEGMKRMPNGDLYAPSESLKAWRLQHTSDGEQRG